VRWLTEYQRGSIFGAVLIGVAFAAAISVVPPLAEQPESAKSTTKSSDITASAKRGESIWERTTLDPVAFFTLGLLIVAGAQAGLFLWQLSYMRHGLKDAAIAARAAKESADASKAQAVIAGTAFADARRPYVYVTGALRFIVEPNKVGGLEPFVEYVAANYGQTPAVIQDVRTGFFLLSDDEVGIPNEALFPEENPLLTHRILGHREVPRPIREYASRADVKGDGGIATKIEFRSLGSAVEPSASPKYGAGKKLFFRVIVRYRGPFTDGHETSACWRYHPEDFFVSAGPEANYEK